MEDYFNHDVIVHLNPANPDGYDGGDSSQRCGAYWFGIYLRNKKGFGSDDWPYRRQEDFQLAIDSLEINQSGLWRRNKYQYNQPEDYSADQQVSLQCALKVHNKIEPLKRMIFKQWKHFGKYQNADIRKYEWTIDFRCLGWWWMYPLICILDLGLLVNLIIRIIKNTIDPDNVGDTLNNSILILFCCEVYPSPTSLLSKFIMRRTNFQQQWDWYFRQDSAPPLNELYKPLLK